MTLFAWYESEVNVAYQTGILISWIQKRLSFIWTNGETSSNIFHKKPVKLMWSTLSLWPGWLTTYSTILEDIDVDHVVVASSYSIEKNLITLCSKRLMRYSPIPLMSLQRLNTCLPVPVIFHWRTEPNPGLNISAGEIFPVSLGKGGEPRNFSGSQKHTYTWQI